MRRAAALTVLALAVLPRAGTIAASQDDDITPVTVAVMAGWVAAVQNHVPGKRDSEVEMVSGLTFDNRRDSSVSMGFFLSFLQGVRPAEPARTVAALPRGAFTELVSRGSLYHILDGEILGEKAMEWNWPGETIPHLGRAAVVLPHDARILFDRASYAGVQGLPRTQVLVSDQSSRPLAANPTGPVLFYAHLFAGRVAQQQGKIADAAKHYKAADAVFPGAQSAGLARSQAALLESDAAGALESIRRIDKSSTARDPWRWYQLAAGRDADALLLDMWSQVSR